jgi:hypothetical protein
VRCRTDSERMFDQNNYKVPKGSKRTRRCLQVRNDLAVETGHAAGRPFCQSASTMGQAITKEVDIMLYTIAVILLILWLLGLVTSYTLGGFVHVLLVIALIMIVFNLVSGRRAL